VSSPIDPLSALDYVLEDKLRYVSDEHCEAGRRKLEARRSYSELEATLRAWAVALTEACGEYLDRVPEKDPVNATSRIMEAIEKHLRLPEGCLLTPDAWSPDDNGVRDFILATIGPRLTTDGNLLLPAWQHRRGFGALLAGQVKKPYSEWMSIEDSLQRLRELEELFADVMMQRAMVLCGEATLLVSRLPEEITISTAEAEPSATKVTQVLQSKKAAREQKLAEARVAAQQKLDNPDKNPYMSVYEVMAALNVSRTTIYSYLDYEKLEERPRSRSAAKNSRKLILTRSVAAYLTPPEE
jgi:predicted DNA-binding transcriptional regulator AlpA